MVNKNAKSGFPFNRYITGVKIGLDNLKKGDKNGNKKLNNMSIVWVSAALKMFFQTVFTGLGCIF